MMANQVDNPNPLFDNLRYFEKEPNQIPENAKPYQAEFLAAYQFLYSYRGSDATFRAYRRELERLLHWAWMINKTSILALKRENIEAFIEFCQSPPTSWIGPKNVSRFITHQGERQPHPEWRPFVLSKQQSTHYQLSEKAVQVIFSILSSFYTFLSQEELINTNPVSQIRQKSKYIRQQQDTRVIRRLSSLQWSYVIETAEIMANSNPEIHERTLFIMNALYAMYLRISELVASTRWRPTMGDFFQDQDGLWWFKTVGKGNKMRTIVVSDAMLNALKRYRKSRGLTPYPLIAEKNPLIPTLKGDKNIASTRQITNIVQKCFDETIQRLIADNFQDEANQLSSATVHWLRHTGISDDVKIRPREHVRDDAGHGSSAITDRYIDIERRARHQSGKKKKIKQDE